MKLLKKLVPLTVLATTASVVTPMVTSCSNSSKWDVNWSKKDGRYLPEVDIHEATETPMSLSDATKAYFDAIKDDYKIFAQDIAYWYLCPGFTAVDVLQVKVNDVVKDEDLANTYRISYKLHLEGHIHPESEYVFETYDISFDNIPYSIMEAEVSTNHYCCLSIAGILSTADDETVSFATLQGLDDWSIDVTYSNFTSTSSTTIDSSNIEATPVANDPISFVIMLGAMGLKITDDDFKTANALPTYYMSKVALQTA